MADQQYALSLVGSKVLVCSFPCLDSVIIYEQSHSIEKECLKYQMFHKLKNYNSNYQYINIRIGKTENDYL